MFEKQVDADINAGQRAATLTNCDRVIKQKEVYTYITT